MKTNFYMPTKVIMESDCVVNHSGLMKNIGKKAIIVTGATSAKINGALDDVLKALEQQELEYVLFDKVMSNPTINCVYEGAEYARTAGADFVIAIGGGSPMDAAKAIALLTVNHISEEALFSGQYGDKALPMVFIPTTAGTGSEVTPYAILTNDKAQTKTSMSSPILFPTIAFLDAKYMSKLSYTTTVNTAIDALSHSVEGMLTKRATAISDMIAIESITIIAGCLKSILEENLTHQIREQLLYASMLAGVVISHTGTTAVHSMGYSLTYFKDVDHGRANGLLLAEFLKFTWNQLPEKIEKILNAMQMDSLEQVSVLIGKLLKNQEEITKEELDTFVSIASKAKNIANCVVSPEVNDLITIYERSLIIKE